MIPFLEVFADLLILEFLYAIEYVFIQTVDKLAHLSAEKEPFTTIQGTISKYFINLSFCFTEQSTIYVLSLGVGITIRSNQIY